nr:MAG TPA: hypothetical protein [Caudoviricetes sp.]
MNSHRPFQETYYQQCVLSSLRFADLPLVLSVGYIFIALRCKGANSRHIMQEFDEKFSYFFVARGLMGRIVQKVCVFLREKACFRAIYCSICTKNPQARGPGMICVFVVFILIRNRNGRLMPA